VIAFGPVPSRRLGRSLGVNNIPPKHCSYSCVYCQVGRTTRMRVTRKTFHRPQEVVSAVERKIERCRATGEAVDYITFVPDGEPTLDIHLGEEIRTLKRLGIPIAVITNGSLLWRQEVRADLAAADVVSVKVDATQELTWRRVNRPSPRLSLDRVLDGIREFAGEYPGGLLTETMLVAGVNDDATTVEEVATFLEPLAPRCAYVAVPTRPPAECGVVPPDEEAVVRAYEILARRLPRVELLTGDEEGPFGHTGDPAEDLQGILAIHPMREAAARRYLAEAGARRETLETLLASGCVVRVRYRGQVFLTPRFGRSA
jgi:wyosine [tRNA(Phe)-imidazoG37] synthetase (radical SAM superfamily)